MSEGMRMQSQLAADLEVYRAKGELIALRAENARLRKALRVAVFLDGPDTVQPEFERWSALVDEGLKENFNEWYVKQVLAALDGGKGV